MTLYHKWGVKNGFIFVLQFFLLVSDSLGCVPSRGSHSRPKCFLFTENVTFLDNMGIGVIKINGFTVLPYLVICTFYAAK